MSNGCAPCHSITELWSGFPFTRRGYYDERMQGLSPLAAVLTTLTAGAAVVLFVSWCIKVNFY